MEVHWVARASAEELAAIGRLELSLGRPGWSGDELDKLYEGSTSSFWVAHKDEGVVGHLLLQQVADECEVLSVAVVPSSRRQGVARSLLNSAFTALKPKDVFLEVRATNAAAIGLYEGLGFRAVGRRRRYYSDGEDARVMRLSFGGGDDGS